MPKHTATIPIVSHNMILRPLSRKRRLKSNPLQDCEQNHSSSINIVTRQTVNHRFEHRQVRVRNIESLAQWAGGGLSLL